ncbi:hypothetical protein Moror_3550 [Moniliophthora roreri MCA 2997]|uniref:Uncharacterized protein n=1 Tax=Moniliophthora roreri (strain MCA 2997) TaxID=1381753 RepID=V2W2K0_MONRO|nr:hypothetical protein Moror_3550 [Moniliophthora roreri MCA 2997]
MLEAVYNCWWKCAGDIPEGGRGKKAMFADREMAMEAQLEDGPLKDLIVELEEALAVRYNRGPGQGDWDHYRQSQAIPSATHPVQRYLDSMAKLKQSDWMLALFDAAIAQPEKLIHEPKARGIDTTTQARIEKTATSLVTSLVTSSRVGTRSGDNKRKSVREQPSGSGSGTVSMKKRGG